MSIYIIFVSFKGRFGISPGVMGFSVGVETTSGVACHEPIGLVGCEPEVRGIHIPL